ARGSGQKCVGSGINTVGLGAVGTWQGLFMGSSPWRVVPSASASEEKAYAAEQALAGLRLAIILLNSLVYVFLLDKKGTFPALAYGIIVAANAYALFVVFFQPYRRFPVLLSSYFTTLLDAAFITIWLVATGGYASPFFPLWLVSTTAVAFRYGYVETLFASLVYAVCD